MKRLFLSVFMLLLAVSFNSYATLIEMENAEGEHVVFDDVAGQYWVWDLDAFSVMTYNEKLEHITDEYAASEYYGQDDWHMATSGDLSNLMLYTEEEIAGAFGPTRVTTNPTIGLTVTSWRGSIDELGSDNSNHLTWAVDRWVYEDGSIEFNSGYPASLDDFATEYLGAWVATGAAPVPEPATIFLLSTGLVGIIGSRKKFRK